MYIPKYVEKNVEDRVLKGINCVCTHYINTFDTRKYILVIVTH